MCGMLGRWRCYENAINRRLPQDFVKGTISSGPQRQRAAAVESPAIGIRQGFDNHAVQTGEERQVDFARKLASTDHTNLHRRAGVIRVLNFRSVLHKCLRPQPQPCLSTKVLSSLHAPPQVLFVRRPGDNFTFGTPLRVLRYHAEE